MFDMNPIARIAFNNVFIAAGSQFFVFPILSYLIKSRFNELNIRLKSRAVFSMFTMSGFWSESRKVNKELQDQKISRYLRAHKIYMWYLFGSFFLILISSLLGRW